MVKPCQTVEKPSANANGSNPLENGRQDDFFVAKNPISRAKAGEGRTAGSRIPVHQLIKTFLTSSHGGAMSSAAAMDLYSPGIP